MAKRWVTEEEFNELSNKFQEGGDVQSNPLMEFFKQLPSELQEKIQMLPPEKQQEVLIQLMQKAQQQQPAEQQQFVIGGKIDNYSAVQDSLANSMYSPDGKFFFNRQQYLDYQNLYYPQPLEDNLNQSITNNYFIKKYKPRIKNSFEEGGETQGIPVEAERNENVTVQDGQQPQVEGGYLEQQSHNPVTGQSTYEIPDNEHNNAHGESGNGSSQEGVNMELTEGDVINSNKTKIPVDFKIYGKNFKNKTFKEASDYLAKQETKIQDDFAQKVKEGKTDKVSDGALQIMLAKLGKNRDELNELQEQVLESKKQKEHNILMDDQVAKYGKIVLEVDKAKEGLNVTMDRYLNYMSKGGKVTTASAKKAQNNVYQSFKKFENFADQVLSNPDLSIYDIQQRYRNSGLTPLTTRDNTSYYSPTFKPINKSKIIGDFKSLIAREETGGWSNPYIAIAGVSEKEAAVKSFKELQAKAASSAIGKYQFVWNIHKNDIARVTGVKDPDAFRNNPQAQEKFMDWFRDTQLLPQATQLKQRYQLPLSIEKVMAMIHLEGKAGLEKKIKAGTLKTSTMANNFKNASPLDYASQFKEGGKIYAEGGNGIDFTKVSDFNKENWQNLNKQAQDELGISFDNPGQYQDYMLKNYPDLVKTMFDKGFWSNTNQGKTTPTSTIPFDDKELYHAFRDNKYNRRGFIPETKTFDDISAYQQYIRGKTKVGGNYYFDPELNTWVSPDINENYYNQQSPSTNEITSITDNRNNLNKNKLRSTATEQTEEDTTTTPEANNQNKQASWIDKLKYGIRESLPYLRNIALMREEQFNPVLQQKPYDNPYDNMRTDYSIQSNLNDNQNALLTAMADSRGNPSVRNVRLAQLAANTQNINNQLYTQKYNQELSLENQKQVGQSQYRNQLDDTNRNLRKQFEQEVLQTREIARQQKNMAIDNMMNTYLRKAEEDQALKLALANTNWDWDKFKQELINNPEKARAEFMRQQYIAKNSPSQNNYTMSTDYYIDNKGIPRKKPSKETEDNRGKYGLKVKKS